jgi:hypothetical protein
MPISAKQWGPPFWQFLHLVSYGYPDMPNEVTKRKYYDLIMNFPLFIPDPAMARQFAVMLDKYPPVAYLDKRDSFIRWVSFIHNKINVMIGKREIPILESVDKYFKYLEKTREIDEPTEKIYWIEMLVYFILIIILSSLVYFSHVVMMSKPFS